MENSQTINIQRILILHFSNYVRMIYAIKINKWLNNDIQQYVYSEKTVKLQAYFQTLASHAANERRRVRRKITLLWYTLSMGIRSIVNVYLSWTLAGCLRPPEKAFSSTCALTRWRNVLPSCLDSVTSWHLFRLVHVLCTWIIIYFK